ncbi:MAG: hypothetical protein H0T90_05830 [Gemmatimonadales bacterium]|nr:hypothetical protein [Gemmatimonadales bacterium]
MRLPDLQRRLSLHAAGMGVGVVHVVECSETQAADLAGQLASTWEVRAEPWSLERPGEPPEGPIMATYFHYNDIRRRWPGRFPLVHFVAIHPDPALAARIMQLQPHAGEVVLCERDQRMAANIAADLSRVLPIGFSVQPLVAQDPAEALQQAGSNDAVLFGPRVWGLLAPAVRADRRAVEVRYILDDRDLDLVAGRMGWRRIGGEASLRRSTA